MISGPIELKCKDCKHPFVFTVDDQRFHEKRGFKQPKRCKSCRRKKREEREDDNSPDWEGKCDVCGMSPIVPGTGLCGPCTFGEADTINGNW